MEIFLIATVRRPGTGTAISGRTDEPLCEEARREVFGRVYPEIRRYTSVPCPASRRRSSVSPRGAGRCDGMRRLISAISRAGTMRTGSDGIYRLAKSNSSLPARTARRPRLLRAGMRGVRDITKRRLRRGKVCRHHRPRGTIMSLMSCYPPRAGLLCWNENCMVSAAFPREERVPPFQTGRKFTPPEGSAVYNNAEPV